MPKLSVPQVAERLGVSSARVRQRVIDGSLVAEKIGGRWLIDLEASRPQPPRRGRPVLPASVWWSLAVAEGAEKDHVIAASAEMEQLSPPSRSRAVRRLAAAVHARDHDALLAWLSNRASRVLYVAAPGDLAAMREDSRLAVSGVSHPKSDVEDLRILEAYVSDGDVEGVVGDYWLEKPLLDERPNVVLHVAPVRPRHVGALLLAADLAEHGGPRELNRAHELLEEALDALSMESPDNAPLSGQGAL